jgi:hypothetical protein
MNDIIILFGLGKRSFWHFSPVNRSENRDRGLKMSRTGSIMVFLANKQHIKTLPAGKNGILWEKLMI